MKYQKPKCDCGADLVYKIPVKGYELYAISVRGGVEDPFVCNLDDNGTPTLYCDKCDSSYSIDNTYGYLNRGEKMYI